ncbi:MAG: hypothetical protein K0S07_125 [Chlamydiales bacterium]|jgi:hypothetical protein|nr:hypothetical protein [Chlamydiales bacterium]
MSYLPKNATSTQTGVIKLSSNLIYGSDQTLVNQKRGALVKLTSVSGTNLSGLEINNFNMKYRMHVLECSDIFGTGVLLIDFSINNGTSYLSSGYSNTRNATTTSIESFVVRSDYPTNATIKLYDFSNTSNYKTCLSTQYVLNSGSTGSNFDHYAGMNTTTSAVNGIRIRASTSTISGTLTIYGFLKL